MARTIACRARVHSACYHGKPDSYQEEPGGPTYSRMEDDGTFDGESIVCDACYVALMPHTPSGRGLNGELSQATERVRALRNEPKEEA